MCSNKQSLQIFLELQSKLCKKSVIEPAAGKGLGDVRSFLTFIWFFSFEVFAFSVCTFIYCFLCHFIKL